MSLLPAWNQPDDGSRQGDHHSAHTWTEHINPILSDVTIYRYLGGQIVLPCDRRFKDIFHLWYACSKRMRSEWSICKSGINYQEGFEGNSLISENGVICVYSCKYSSASSSDIFEIWRSFQFCAFAKTKFLCFFLIFTTHSVEDSLCYGYDTLEEPVHIKFV